MSKDFYIQQFIGVKGCQDGILETNDGRFLTIVEILPINFDFQAAIEKEIIIDYFARWTKVAPINFRIKVLSKRTDTNKYVETLWSDYEKENSERCRELILNNINFVQTLGANEGVSHRFFVILEYEGKKKGYSDRSDILYWFERTKDTMQKSLALCNNEIIKHENEDAFIEETCYLILNRDKNIGDLQDRYVNLYNKAYELYEGDIQKLANINLDFCDVISPDKIEIHAKYLIIDNTYYSFLYLPSDSYQERVTGAWASGLINACEGVDVDFFVERKNSQAIRPALRRASTLNKLKINNTEDVKDSFDEAIKAYSSTQYIKDALTNRENFHYISTLITISAENLDDLDEKVSMIEEMLQSNDYTVRSCQNRMLQTLRSYLPFGGIDNSLYELSKRNVTTSGLSSFYPFTSFEVSDNDGILIGVNMHNNSLCIIDNFNTRAYNNANMCILGTSGAGKTFLLQLMAMRWRMRDIQVYIIAPLKGIEFKKMCKNIGGEFITLSSGSNDRVNIMEIRPVDRESSEILEETEFNESILAEKISKLMTFVKLLIPDINLVDERLMDDAIIRTYHKKGITRDNKSLIESEEFILDEYGEKKKIQKYKPMPILTDLYDILNEAENTKHLASLIKMYVDGSAMNFNGATNVNPNNKMTVIDVSNLNSKQIAPGMFVAFDFIWDKIKEDRTKRKVVIIDELWLLMNENAVAASFVMEAFKSIRGYAGAAVAATQDIADFYAFENGKYGKAILNNSKIKLILSLESEEAETVKKIFKFTNEEQKKIMTFQRGEGMVFSNRSTFVCNFRASRLEHDLITTDRSDLARIKQEKKLAS